MTTVTACPACDSTSLRSVTGRGLSDAGGDFDYRCRDCSLTMDESAVVRRTDEGNSHGLEGYGLRLYEADPDALPR